MLKEIKYFIFFLVIILFIFFSIKFYISDENKFRNLSLIDENIKFYKKKLPIISSDTDEIVKYLSEDGNSKKQKYSFWDLLKNEN